MRRTSPVQRTEGARHLFYCGAAPESLTDCNLPSCHTCDSRVLSAGSPVASTAEAGGLASSRGGSQREPVSSNTAQILPSLVTQGQKSASFTNTKPSFFEKTARTQNKGEQRNTEKWQNTARAQPPASLLTNQEYQGVSGRIRCGAVHTFFLMILFI